MQNPYLSEGKYGRFLTIALILGGLCLSTLILAQGATEPAVAMSALERALLAPAEPYRRLEYHLGSWISLLITLSSVLVAIALNHARPVVRTMGTCLASLGCFAVAGWFLLFVLGSGVLSGMRPATYPVGSFDPTMLWIQAGIALLVGLFLLRVAFWQNRRTDNLDLSMANDPDRFGRVSRYLHWITAILFIALFPIGIFASMIPFDAPYRQGYYVAHKTIGLTVLLLLVARVFWHRRMPTPNIDAQLTKWEYMSARVVHFLLYLLMIAMPVTGFVMTTSVGKWSHFYIWDLPLFWDKHLASAELFSLTHKILLPYLCYVVIGAHILGALKHHFIDKHHKSIHRMVS